MPNDTTDFQRSIYENKFTTSPRIGKKHKTHKKLRNPMTQQQTQKKIDKTYFEHKFCQPSVKFELK